jgi:hypothetical protein
MKNSQLLRVQPVFHGVQTNHPSVAALAADWELEM